MSWPTSKHILMDSPRVSYAEGDPDLQRSNLVLSGRESQVLVWQWLLLSLKFSIVKLQQPTGIMSPLKWVHVWHLALRIGVIALAKSSRDLGCLDCNGPALLLTPRGMANYQNHLEASNFCSMVQLASFQSRPPKSKPPFGMKHENFS